MNAQANLTEGIVKSTMTGGDPVGVVFLEKVAVLRGIHPESEASVRAMLECGMIAELVEKKLFPATTISDRPLDGFGLVLRHERLDPLILMTEWSSHMLRDAALAMLEVNRIVRRYGYETKDAHLYNMAFHGTHPMFLDLGSFVKIVHPWAGWRAYDEFIRSAIFSLRLNRQAGSWLRRPLADFYAEYVLSREGYWRLRWGALSQLLPMGFMGRALDFYGRILAIGSQPAEKLNVRHRSLSRRLAVWALKSSGFLNWLTTDFDGLARKVRRACGNRTQTRWQGYQNEFFAANGLPSLSPRLLRVAELIRELGSESTIELGANMGALSQYFKRSGTVSRVVCTDYDEGAVNSAYERFKSQESEGCSVALLDFLSDSPSIKVPPAPARFRADTVVALALSHHLLLVQGVTIELLMSRLAAFGNRHVVVEFMPLGLWDGSPDTPAVPHWYTRDWFRENFTQKFDLLTEEQLERNRIVFLGRKRG